MAPLQVPARVVGLVPAAGRARRLPGLPLSKELFPLGFVPGEDGVPRPRPAILHLLEAYRDAGVTSALVVIRAGKWDIPEYLRDGNELGVATSFLVVPPTPSVPHTLDRAHAFVADRVVALGFPDILFEPQDAYGALLARLAETDADLVLGLFPIESPAVAEKTDMVALDAQGRPLDVLIKQRYSGHRYTWSTAVWRPTFTERLRRAVREHDDSGAIDELQVGDVVRLAIREGMSVEAVTFESGRYLDIGTPEDLVRAVERGWRGGGSR
jgi:glucose-1-phosphate thymidylyltransferase